MSDRFSMSGQLSAAVRSGLATVAAVLAGFALSVALQLDLASAAMVLVVIVAGAALFVGLPTLIGLVALSVLGLGYVVVPPRFAFVVGSSQDMRTLVLFVAATLAISLLIRRITERRATEERARRRQDTYLAEAQRLSQTGSLAWNFKTGEVTWSDETYRICGVAPGQPVTLDLIRNSIHEDDRAGFQTDVQKAVQGRARFNRELRYIRPDGQMRTLHMLGHFPDDQTGQFVGALSDVTEQRAAEQALRDSEFRYRNMFAAMAASFWELDFAGILPLLRGLKKQGVTDFAAYFAQHPEFVRELMRATKVLDVNDQTVTLFGRGDKAELLDNVDRFFPDSAIPVYAGSVIASLTRQPGFSAETHLRRADGTEFEALFTVSFPPESVAGSRFLVGVIDISARVQAQAMLQRVQAEFAHAARVSMLGELTASIAHEVNQPLAAIATNASAGLRWLNRPEPDVGEVRQLTDRIIADARRAADIIARVRSMATRRAPERAAVSINAIVEEAALFLRHEMQGQGVTLDLRLDASAPPILADRTQLQQVLVNLMINAVQAMAHAASPQRRITVQTRADASAIAVTVDDTGPGLTPEQSARVFESFFTTKDSGMGMGLPICRSIIESHGGRIVASNADSGGARFAFTLPQNQAS